MEEPQEESVVTLLCSMALRCKELINKPRVAKVEEELCYYFFSKACGPYPSVYFNFYCEFRFYDLLLLLLFLILPLPPWENLYMYYDI